MPDLLLHEGANRHGVLATLESRTWRARAVAAGALADVEAVASRGAYADWLRRTSAAWSCLPPPPVGPDGAALVPWPLSTVGPDVLDGRADLAADLRDLALPGGGVAGLPAHRPAPAPQQSTDAAFLVGAAYVATIAAADAAVLAGAAVALAEAGDGAPLGTRFLRRCRQLAPARHALQRELPAWAASAGPEAVDRAVLTARSLGLELARALQRTAPGS